MEVFPLEKILEKIDSKYRLITLVAKRSRQLTRGDQPLVTTKQIKPTSVALQEVVEGRIGYEVGVEEGETEKERLEQVRRRFVPPETYVPSLDFKHEKGLAPTELKEKEEVEEEEEALIEEVSVAGEEEEEEEGEL